MAASDACLPLIPSDIALITGPTMLGICLNWGFMGVLAVQIYFYHINFSDDSKIIKSLVYGLALLDTVQTGLVTADAFHWFVFGFGNMNQLDDTFLNSWDVPLLDAVISLIVQSFYCWRIYILRRSFIIPSFIIAISLMQCAAGIAVAVQAHKLGHLSLISTEVASQTTWLVGSTVADVLITAVLTWTLLRSRNKSFPASHGMINKLVYMTVETNLATACTSTLALILFLGVPQHSTLVVPPTAILGKLYTNCLIAVLNNRRMRPGKNTGGSTSENSRSYRFDHTGTQSTSRQDTSLQVKVLRDIHQDRDMELELNSMQKKSEGTIMPL